MRDWIELTNGWRRTALAAALLCAAAHGAVAAATATDGLRFEISAAPGLLSAPREGRVLLVIARSATPEPRRLIGQTGVHGPLIVARDATLGGEAAATIDAGCAAFPRASLAELEPGEYQVQAVFDHSLDLRMVDAPGNLYSDVRREKLDPAAGVVRLELTRAVPDERLPADGENVRFVKIESRLLSAFHGRPIFLRAGVLLPSGFDHDDTERRYPLCVSIGGFATRYTSLRRMAESSRFRREWTAADTPRFVLLLLDGTGPLGDPYQVNSANNGPYGDAITQELIPEIERRFRCIGTPASRFLEGGSTGGWVSLALQIFYPDYFNGVWSFFPDGVDFRAFQLIDIYEDSNAYVNRHGFERPAARDVNGETVFTVRHECQMEIVLGRGDGWTMSGGQWGAWNATYGPRGSDGRPVALWDAKTGAIDRSVIEHWKKYDLRLVLEESWATLGPKLRGKIHVYVGEADDYFLNNAVHLLHDFLKRADPPFEGEIRFGERQGHGWTPLSTAEMLRGMSARLEAAK
ncbi:MAG: hypothetical protein CHACPFDD_01065 [Phycisphaerae bacterium]|nr:hypothetical protein [Phycisphaerae bacterium]